MGLHVGLNSSAAVVTGDGQLVWAEQEERHSRIKNHCGFPTRALHAGADHATRSGLHIERVAIGGHTIFPHDASRRDLRRAYQRVHHAMLAGASGAPDPNQNAPAQDHVRHRLHTVLPGSYHIEAFDHHHCHAAAAYHFLREDDDPYLVVTLDGEGDDHSSTVWIGEHGRLDRIAASHRSASAGLLWFWVTYLMGFQPHEDEYKIMGLAGHVDPHIAQTLGTRLFSPLLDVDDTTLQLVTPPPARTRQSPTWMRQLHDRCQRVRFDHLAAALQSFTERIATRLVSAAVAKTQVTRVLLAGGVAMNVKLNQAVRRLDRVEVLDAMPSAGDESLAIGAAYLAAATLTDHPPPICRPSLHIGSHHATAGHGARAVDVAHRLGCRILAHDPGDAHRAAADALLRGEPVAVCLGRGEFGARALGHRSLLADPRSPAAVAKLNTTIKHRDFWMPFAPVFLQHRAHELLTDYQDRPSRWMMHAYTARRDERLRGAVHPTHWTCRPQMLDPGSDEPVAAVLRHVDAKADLPALINTSLNQHGQPIARTGLHAADILARTPLRYLLLGSCLLEKPA